MAFRRDDFTLGNALCGAAKLTKNTNKDKYKYSGHGTRFDNHVTFSLTNGNRLCKNIIIFVADMSSSVHINNKKKYILILGKGPTDGLDDTILPAKKDYPINFIKHDRKLCSSLHYNGANNYVFVNDV